MRSRNARTADPSPSRRTAPEAPARSPLRLALASPAGRAGLRAASVVAAVQAVGLVLVADALARGVVRAMAGEDLRGPLLTGLVGVLCQASAAWAGKASGARSSAGAKTGMRRRFIARVFAGGGRDVRGTDGSLALLATRSLDEIDDYFTAVIPALTASAVVPLVVGARILWSDWVSALIIVLTLPLVPLFMILIGRYTEERVEDATRALDRLSGHLVELARGVPVLVGLGRLRAQTDALREVSERYRDTTMTTLRVAFLSALALELIATLSVAVVAVFVGVRLVYGHMSLEDGLLALILAPEAYLPLRRLGAAFHSTENGLAAHDRIDAVIGAPVAAARVRKGTGVRVRSLTLRYGTDAPPVLADATAHLGDGGLTAVTGASGAGKSSLLELLAGLLRAGDGTVVTGSLEAPGPVAYAPQSPRTVARTVADEIALRLPAALRDADAADPDRRAAVERCLEFAQLNVDPDFPCAALSPGQQRRLSLARVRASVLAGARLVLVDEPTAHLDETTAAGVRAGLLELSREVLVLAATHDGELVRSADRVVRVADGRIEEQAAGTVAQDCRATAQDAGQRGDAAAVPRAVLSGDVVSPEDMTGDVASAGTSAREREHAQLSAPAAVAAPTTGTLVRRLVRAVDPFSRKFLVAVLFGVLSTAAGAALTGVSAWLIVRASAQPPIMYLLVAIVGVRFFGLSRSVFAYAQRLWLHDAVLDSLTRLRTRLWAGLARRGTADRRIARGGGALRALIADVDDIRDLVPRVVLPPLVAVIVGAAAVIALFIIHPAAGWTLVAALLVALVPASALALAADRRAGVVRVEARGRVLAGVEALLAARDDLSPDGAWRAPAARLAAEDERASASERRALRATGLGESVVVAATTAAALVILLLLGPATGAGDLSGEMLAVAVLLPLGLTDALLDSLSAVQQWPALRRVLGRIDDLDDDRRGDDSGDGEAAVDTAIRSLAVEDLTLRWPGAATPTVDGLSADFPLPGLTLVTGPSGSGKTTLVSALLRFLDAEAGQVRLNGQDAASLTPEDVAGRIAWCPQEAHVFDSTLRGNLLISRDRADAPTDAELEHALEQAGLGDLLLDRGLDARVGASGSSLSGGQRQRLAVARTLLVGADAVILDEPTAHLDEETAHALVRDLDEALAEVGTLVVTHDEGLVRLADPEGTATRIRL
ncbi:thiol reductant ABC exporter subunit CydC [Brevibacterium senegalense]|uniref:thiol reductant ABC exporter subunit CydC n=1 Tax=Brevibacterium senegalense TaxID=1033736 RepID=UPI0002F8EF1F|nr:thiol reductant ABC exporter subunit CydC [Brevibacterium senegalense]